MKAQRRRARMILLTLWLIGSCCLWTPGLPRPGKPAKGVQESDLTGIWYVDYKDYTDSYKPLCDKEEAARFIEILILESDGKYTQLFWDRRSKTIEERNGLWWLERLPDGIGRVHLEKGKSYPHENCGYYIGLSYSNDLTGHELEVDTTKEAILQVWEHHFKKELFLTYPFVRDPDAPVIVQLHRLGSR